MVELSSKELAQKVVCHGFFKKCFRQLADLIVATHGHVQIVHSDLKFSDRCKRCL
ncbi:hypothetical protein Arad_7156 [Rhizobium rhizogenes K84]|uniref:Uncharacterized protein n=1 Tax=Rhizobium rhizogenes (strain K84 / ATCC BAA-868) TaxID=311403 RepID=B9JM05_RHIR8|nr:hypothetical protein Arad_7156 [Rhizobium rhizogenes K84]